MKKIFIYIFLGFLCTKRGFAQTTVEEYNYLTKGYRIQIETGLDMKSGYTLQDAGTYKTSSRSCNFKALIRKNTDDLAGTLAIFHAANGAYYYFCIPTIGSPDELFSAYRASLGILDNADAARDYSFFLSEVYAVIMKSVETSEKASIKKGKK